MVASASQSEHVRAAHLRMRELVQELMLLARSPQADTIVLPQFIRNVVEALDAQSGSIWSFRSCGNLASECEYHTGRVAAGAKGPVTSLVVPVQRAGRMWGVIEVVPAKKCTEQAQRQSLAFVQHMARLLSQRPSSRRSTTGPLENSQQQHSRYQVPVQSASPSADAALLKGASQKSVLSSTPIKSSAAVTNPTPVVSTKVVSADKLNQLVLAMYESLDLEATAYVIANEFRQLLRCDRVSVAVVQKAKCQIVAVSGQEAINRRADMIRQLEKLAQQGVRSYSPIWLKRTDANVPADLAEVLEQYSLQCDWQQLGLLPLRVPSGTSKEIVAEGVLVIEKLSSAADDALPNVAQQLAPHAAQALAQIAAQSRILFLPLWRKLGTIRHAIGQSSQRRVSAVCAGLTVAVLFLTLYPVSFQVQGRGPLQPVAQSDVFADIDGVVTAVRVEHGDQVRQGDVLLELRNTELELQIAELLGERRAAQEQLISVQRMRHAESISREEENRLTGQMLQLQEKMKGSDEQHHLLQKKKERLVVRSPIAGQITSWNLERKLLYRPVVAGQVLVSIADGDGLWNLEVYLPESEAGHLLAARCEVGQRVDYLVTSQATAVHSGVVTHIDDTAQLYEEYGHAVRVLVEVDKRDMPLAVAGTTATARIECGQRSIGYVWLHRLMDFIHSRIVFPLI